MELLLPLSVPCPSPVGSGVEGFQTDLRDKGISVFYGETRIAIADGVFQRPDLQLKIELYIFKLKINENIKF